MMATGPLAVAQLGLVTFFSFRPQASCSTVSRSAPAACPLAECHTSFAHRVAAAVAALVVGRRRSGGVGYAAPPHNVPFILFGAGLLWFGWFGFNGGSGLVAGNLASLACLTTNTAAAAAALGWMLLETWHFSMME